MEIVQFRKIYNEMKDKLDGDGFMVGLHLSNGRKAFGALKFLSGLPINVCDGIVVLEQARDENERAEYPDLYLPVANIIGVEGPFLSWDVEQWMT